MDQSGAYRVCIRGSMLFLQHEWDHCSILFEDYGSLSELQRYPYSPYSSLEG